MKTLFHITTLILILTLFALPVLADEATEEAPENGEIQPVSSELPSDAPVDMEMPAWAVELGYGALLVTALIGAGKYVPFLQNIPIARQKIVLVVILLIVHLYVKENGDLATFSAKITSLGELATRLVAFAGMYAGSAGIHEASGNLPLLGNSRPVAQQSNERPAM